MAALDAASANVRSLEANVDQTRLSTRTQIAAFEGKVEAQRAALRTAELKLQYATIQAPIAGRVGDSLIPVGGLVTPNSPQPLTTIVPLDPIWVRFKMTESEYLAWAGRGRSVPGNGLPLTLLLADKTEFPSKGHIENALNQVDPKTGTLELQASFPNPRRTLLPGQFGRVRLQAEERRNAIVVPQKAVQQLQSMQVVYCVGPDNRVSARTVVAGARVGSDWVIEQGLQAGERVIVEGLLKVRPGAQSPASALFRTGPKKGLIHGAVLHRPSGFRHGDGDRHGHPGRRRHSGAPRRQLSRGGAPRGPDHRNYLGGNSLDLEKTVAQPIEEQLIGLDGMLYFLSSSSNDGSLSIQVTFRLGTNPDMATVQTQNRVNIAMPRLAAGGAAPGRGRQESLHGVPHQRQPDLAG